MHVTRLVVLGSTVALYCGCTAEVADRSADSAEPRAASEALAVDYGEYGFLWANRATTASYSPDTNFQFNTQAAGNFVTRTSKGTYFLVFDELNISLFYDYGNLQVVAYGTTDAHCDVTALAHSTDDKVRAAVSCRDRLGALVDSQFVAMFSTSDWFTGAYKYFGEDQRYEWSSSGDSMLVSASGVGRYKVAIGGLGAGYAVAHVTAVGPAIRTTPVSTMCHPIETRAYAIESPRVEVDVECVNSTTHAPAYSDFMLAYFKGSVPNWSGEGAFMVSNDSQPALNTKTTPGVRYHSLGKSVTYQRTSTGTYKVSFPMLPPSVGTALVSAYGTLPSSQKPGIPLCNVTSWFTDLAGGTTVGVRCRNSRTGSAINAKFGVTFMSEP